MQQNLGCSKPLELTSKTHMFTINGTDSNKYVCCIVIFRFDIEFVSVNPFTRTRLWRISAAFQHADGKIRLIYGDGIDFLVNGLAPRWNFHPYVRPTVAVATRLWYVTPQEGAHAFHTVCISRIRYEHEAAIIWKQRAKFIAYLDWIRRFRAGNNVASYTLGLANIDEVRSAIGFGLWASYRYVRYVP